MLASAFSAIVVYAQELMPGKVGMISGLFFGFAFGMAEIGRGNSREARRCDEHHFVYQVCAFLPAIGLLTGFLPNLDTRRRV